VADSTTRVRTGRNGLRMALSMSTAAALLLAVAACSGDKVDSEPGASSDGTGAAGDCGTVKIAVNPWVGYEANAAVFAYVAEQRLGCTVQKKDLKEEVSWQGFETGEVDLVIENWGHDDLVKKYITERKVAVDLGPTGNKGIIGWYVPPWLAAEHPEVLDWKNLNKFADKFKTSESGGKGQLLDGDPSYVTNDTALVKNLKLNFSVVQGGSEAALIQSFRTAQKQKKWLLAYFYEPQWFFDELELKRVTLPKYTSGCDADPQKVACDYPPYDLNKIARKGFADSDSPAADLARKFQWTNEDQNLVSKYISEEKLSPEKAAEKWVNAHKDMVDGWLAAD
jgi:glycine betaine/proline transport system substrate-binding protein